MTIRIRQITADTMSQDVETTARLAQVIWTEHYTSLIGAPMVAYMLENIQSATRISRDISENGYRYWLAEDAATGEAIGYCAAFQESNLLFLSKIYVLDTYRGRGVGRALLSPLKSWCDQTSLGRIQLLVSKGNAASIAAYKKMGFKLVGTRTTPIGGGFTMNDYVMDLMVGDVTGR